MERARRFAIHLPLGLYGRGELNVLGNKCWILLVVAGIASAQTIDSAKLLSRVKAKVRENTRTIPKFICRQKIERQAFATGHSPRSCGALGDSDVRKGLLVTSDRAVLDVMLSESTEMFAWPGAKSFEADDQDDLLGGGFSGTGDFATFVISIFTLDAATFYYHGSCETGSGVYYTFDIPASASHHTVTMNQNTATLGYHGSFEVDPQSADLLRLTVIPTDLSKALPAACDVRTQMTYTKAAVAAGEFTIPASTEKQYLSRDGTRYMDRVSYESCHEYSSESLITFEDKTPADDAPRVTPALPPSGTEVQLRLSANVDSAHGAAGDSVEATLVRAVRDTQGHAIPAGTVFRGHLVQLLTIHSPQERVTMGFRFDAMVLNGQPVSVNLTPIGSLDRRGAEVFTFPGRNVIRGKGTVMRWRVVS
jgi:hypothetical protein